MRREKNYLVERPQDLECSIDQELAEDQDPVSDIHLRNHIVADFDVHHTGPVEAATLMFLEGTHNLVEL